MKVRSFLIAAGGTGGHLFPGIAIAAELKVLSPKLTLIFVITGKIFEVKSLAKAGYLLESLKVRGFRGVNFLDKLIALALLPKAIYRACQIIIKHRPSCVLVMGSYASFPLGVAAWMMGIPLLVQEQNSVAGLTNYLLARLAQKIFISFANAKSYFPTGRTLLLGNPVRFDLIKQACSFKSKRSNLAYSFRLLVLGGSQGAHSLNQAVCSALHFLQDRCNRLFIVHQTGVNEEKKVRRFYKQVGQNGQVAAFFENIGYQYALAHLCICRSGANTICELTAIGRAAILVPYPFASGDHQSINAQILADAGAAVIIPETQLTGVRIANLINSIISNPNYLIAMESAAAALGRPQAARKIARVCLDYYYNKENS